MFKIFLNNKKDKTSSDVENKININVNNNGKMLPVDDITDKINEYEEYLEEKKNSQVYRLSFNITPICSNVLFNKISEIVYHEGSDDCIVFQKNNPSGDVSKNKELKEYCDYKNINERTLTRKDLLRDTGFSHVEAGGVVYHCGFDIFNNHMLRKKEFNIVNRLSYGDESEKNNKYFNTIYDTQRDYWGETIKGYKNILENTGENEAFTRHLYMVDTLHTFEESINENLVEKNGWVGFINPTTLNIPNFVKNETLVSLNKCMNNNKPCEMIDMYPDRSLFSFIPKINKYRENRVENNWDYCLTYPCSNYYDNYLVQFKCENGEVINGLKCNIVDDIFGDNNDIIIESENNITLKTDIKNNFSINSLVNIVLIGDINGEEEILMLENNEKILKIGHNGKEKEYFFTIYGDDLLEKINKFSNPSKVEIRVRRVSDGGLCTYYFRQFRRIPNFKNSGVYIDDNISDKDINFYSEQDFNSSLNGMGFSRTIYNDRNAQILFNDDISLKGLKDNLGREISEIYLTIVKNNDGYKEWYEKKEYSNSAVTFSHCFGKVTSALNIQNEDIKDFNIHKIHNLSPEILQYNELDPMWNELCVKEYEKLFNVKIENGEKIYSIPEVLEDDINIHGTKKDNKRNNIFLGDIVEFNKYGLNEVLLENVYHRFNTVQREIVNKEDSEYRDIVVDEIYSDDYDLLSGFTINERLYNQLSNKMVLPINIDAEGYYYNPHYKIQIKEFKNKINQGEHIRIGFNNYFIINENTFDIVTNKNYFFEPMSELYFYHKISKNKIVGKIVKISGKNKNNIRVIINSPTPINLNEYIIYKLNSEKPSNAYELDDGSGIYLWRDIKEDYDINSEISKYMFTNNAHYINKNIIFYLFRQDPEGKYNLSNISMKIPIVNVLSIEGVTNNYDNIETMLNEIDGEELLC